MSDDWCPENDGAYRMELAARERDTITALRERLEQAELLSEHHERMEYRRGFREGVEAARQAYGKIAQVYYGRTVRDMQGHFERDINSLSPTDKTPTVAEAAKVLLDARSPDGLTVLPNYVMILLRALAAQKGE